jgi:elongation factor 1-beta
MRLHGAIGVLMTEYNVAAQVKIYIDDQSAMPAVKSGLEKIAKVNKLWEEDVGFGIKVLKANLLLDDSEGGMEALEEKIRKLGNVSEVEVETVTRV